MIPFANQPWGWTPLAPILCAVHCAATPALLAFAPSLSVIEALEVWFLALTGIVAAVALRSGIANHGRWVAAVPVTAGLAFWTTSLTGGFAPLPEEGTTGAAALLVAGGLFWNARASCRRREDAERAACRCLSCEGEWDPERAAEKEESAADFA